MAETKSRNRRSVHRHERAREVPGPDHPSRDRRVDPVVVPRGEVDREEEPPLEGPGLLRTPQQIRRGVGEALGLDQRPVPDLAALPQVIYPALALADSPASGSDTL